jgi:hypothetical protein
MIMKVTVFLLLIALTRKDVAAPHRESPCQEPGYPLSAAGAAAGSAGRA